MNVPTQVPVKSWSQTPAQSPLNMFNSLQHELDHLFGEFAPALPGRRGVDLKCRMDLAETKDGLELTVELPGMEEKDVQVAAADGLLTVSGEKKFESERKDKSYRFIERGYGSFARSIALPQGVDPEQIKATLKNGVLKVAIPTPARPEPRKIEVKPSA